MRCVQEYPHIMTVRPSDAYTRLGDSHWTPDAVFTILYESSTGKIPVKGMGYKGSFGGNGGNGFDSMWTDMSEIVRPTRDGVYGREYISTVVDIGRKPHSLDFGREQDSDIRTVRSPIPVIFDSLPEACSNDTVQRAVSSAAARLKTFYISKPDKQNGAINGNFVPIVKQSDTDANPGLLHNAGIIEYDANEPDLAPELRKHSASAVITARLPLSEGVEEASSNLVRAGIDVLHLYADYHGMDYSDKPRHISSALKSVHTRLVKEGIRDQVTIIASGGITLAEHVPKAIICGADMVGIDTALLVALQAEFKGEARDREACGLVPRRIDPEWGAQRIVNLMASWHDQLIEILSAMGMRDVRRLRGDVGRSMVDGELREQAFEGIAWAT